MVGMEPAVKPAAAATRSGVVGVLATTGTLQSAKFAALLDRFATDVRVITQPCPGLVELIETGDLHSPAAPVVATLCRAAAQRRLRHHHPRLHPLSLSQADAQADAAPSISLIDTGAAVARQLKRLLAERDLLATVRTTRRFWTSGDVYFEISCPCWETSWRCAKLWREKIVKFVVRAELLTQASASIARSATKPNFVRKRKFQMKRLFCLAAIAATDGALFYRTGRRP
jgi:hypothetical protein